MPRHELVPQALARRVRAAGGTPLLTHYGADGSRAELSVASFANWVDKTANLLDDLGLDADADVALPVLIEAPAHWMALVWPFACWRAGVGVRVVARPDAAPAALVVTGPEDPTPLGAETFACSLDPWGRGLTGLPGGVADYSSEALTQPDGHPGAPAAPEAPAWTDGGGVRTHGDLAALEPVSDRVAVTPDGPWAAVAWLVRAVLGGGSLVVVEAAATLARCAAAERARVPRWAAPTAGRIPP